MAKKYVYLFKEGRKEWKDFLGGKGANLCEMSRIGIPVPPGFVISAEVCDYYYKNGRKYPKDLNATVEKALKHVEGQMKKKFGDKKDPLLFSVRSGAASSMPGMMDTILNLGLNDETVKAIAIKTKNDRFAYDSYRRFMQMFGDVVVGVDHDKFEEELQAVKDKRGVKQDIELKAKDLMEVAERYKALYKREGKTFPQEPMKQLWMAVDAVFGSWNNPRAIKYRQINEIRGLMGTAVNVQAMVFGNKGATSGTGVCFTRNPSTGENKFYGEFLMDAQGEDVVAGIRTPESIEQLAKHMPVCYKQLVAIRSKLEKHYKDMQDMEFTIEEGKLWMLQTRNGKRTAGAAVRAAVEMVKEKLIDKETAILRVDPKSLDQLLHKTLDPKAKVSAKVLAKGLPASPGAAVGKIVFTADRAVELHEKNPEDKLILVRTETSPEDIAGMNVAVGILTSRGGMTSHAAVVARGMGKTCVAGCSDCAISESAGTLNVAGKTFKEGDSITLEGSLGEVIEGKVPVVDPELSGDFKTLISWADTFRRLKIKTNADTPHDAQVAKDFGAEGIGLCRTEHMFFEESRIKAVREMIVAETVEERKKALAKIEPMQKEDFLGLFKVMNNLPVIIRLLDPPLHEFLPKEEDQIKEIATDLKITPQKLKEIIDSLHEFNPMLGFRGCRLGVKFPEINEMQARAIFAAALEAKKKGIKAKPRIEVPLVGHVKEYRVIRDLIEGVAKEMKITRKEIDYEIGTMIEVPRAAITSDEIAKEADFLSFGTNDLTQMSCGFSRDDAGSFLGAYVEKGIYERDPFQAIDQEGVGKLMQICVEKARSVKPKIEIGICGEHGGEPSSVEFCHRIGMNDVSCSPFRVPIARLAAAQAAVKEKQKGKAKGKAKGKK